MVREARLLDEFVDFAAAVAASTGPIEAAAELAQRAGGIFAAEAAAVFLTGSDGSLRTVAWSSERGRRLASLEVDHVEGPGHDAVRARSPVVAAGDNAKTRWPGFTRSAAHAGLHSFAAVPLRRRGAAVGALVVAVERVETDDVPVAQALADVAALAITEARAALDARTVAAQLQTALDARVVIEQAKGVVAERSRVTVDEAFAALRTYARGRHQLLTDVARRVVAGELQPGLVTGAIRDRSGSRRGAR